MHDVEFQKRKTAAAAGKQRPVAHGLSIYEYTFADISNERYLIVFPL